MSNSIKLSSITMFDLANGVSGDYKGNDVSIHQCGKMSYIVKINDVSNRVGGVAAVKDLLKKCVVKK